MAKRKKKHIWFFAPKIKLKKDMFGEIGRVEVSLISLILIEKINAGNEPSSIHFLPSKHKYWLKAYVQYIV